MGEYSHKKDMDTSWVHHEERGRDEMKRRSVNGMSTARDQILERWKLVGTY